MRSLKRSPLSIEKLLKPSFWVNLAERKRESKEFLKPDFWNLISEDYDSLEESPFYRFMQEDIILEMEKRGALRSDFSFFDVGCGTGNYSIKIAKKVAKVYALDISENMLKIFRKKCEEACIGNINLIQADWRKFEPDTSFDTIFVSMTPILRDLKEVERLLRYAKRFFIAVQWAGLRKNPLLEEIEKKFFKKSKPDLQPGFWLLFNYLYTLGKAADVKFYEGFFERKSPLEKLWTKFKFRLEAKGYKISSKKEKDILNFLKEKTKDGFIETKTKVRIGALFLKIKEE